ncbi:Putative membrane lipoprotein [Arabidopsis thaliana]|uniref:Membrane lipoprotein n=1 Tax=Arabidopsis thaliana TaxID=3702 RepID=Q3E927_ARATH|nr:Putative membrane lipoprotein [Arabidopsis thaliana]AED93562.1 Putative membrane lipoprotein [Arabidopsis thaliana]|eukprot:NP_850869.2 Putative membrane lipoprotein [Arabidopsis thaliana]
MTGNMYKMMMLMALIMMTCGLQACNATNVDESKPDPKLECFKNCSISCGKQNQPCYEVCLTKCGLPKRPSTSTPSSSSTTA